MTFSPWTVPFTGLLYFVGRPRMWGWLFLGIILSFASLLAAFFLGIHWGGPGWLSSSAAGFFVVILDIVIVLPLILNLCFARAFVHELKQEGRIVFDQGMTQALTSSFFVFFRTLKWRILWPLLLLISLVFAPLLVYPLALMAANHLLVLESLDLGLSIFGYDGSQRVKWLSFHYADIWRIALSGGAMAFLLSLLFLAWLLWILAIATGVFVWIKEQEESRG